MGVLGHEAIVNYQEQSAGLPVVIVDDEGSPLFSQNWLNAIKLEWRIKIVSTGQDEFLGKYQTLFMEEFGTMEGLIVRLFTSKKQLPCFVRLDQHSMHHERPWIAYNGVLEKVKYSNWARYTSQKFQH